MEPDMVQKEKKEREIINIKHEDILTGMADI